MPLFLAPKPMTNYSSMDELLQKTKTGLKTLKYGDVVEGRVVSVNRNQILVDIKAKAAGLVSVREIAEDPGLYKSIKIGDIVLASVLQTENDKGYVVLSMRKAASESRWRELEKKFKDGEVMKVRVTEFNKGGLLVDIGAGSERGSLQGFIPLSHLAKERLAVQINPEEMVGATLEAKIIEMDRSLNRLVFSEKEAQSKMTSAEKRKIFESFSPGQVVEGEVSAVLPFGLLIELSNIEGLCHISEISWEKVDDAGSLYKVGQKVKAKVLEVEPEQSKLSLSIKSLIDNPWEAAAEKYKVGERVFGTVSKIVPFGAFVLLEPGLEGLIHVSETVGPLKPGEKVEAEIISLEPQKQKLGLSVRKVREVLATYK